MRTNILMQADGTIIGGDEDLLNTSSNSGVNYYSLFYNQISLEFFNSTITDANGAIEPNPASKVTSGLTGNLTLDVRASENAPYSSALPGGNVIDVSTTSMIAPFVGVVGKLTATSSTVAGCNFINILIDRK